MKNVDEVWANWEKIKRAEKAGTKTERKSALDGIPKYLPALLRAEKLLKKARKAKLLDSLVGLRCRAAQISQGRAAVRPDRKSELAKELFELASFAQSKNWSAEELLSHETKRREKQLRRMEQMKYRNEVQREVLI